MHVSEAMLEAVPSGRSRVRFSFWANLFSDGFRGSHTAKTNIKGANEGCTTWICVCIDWVETKMLPIGVGSSVSMFLKTVTVSPLSLLVHEVKGSSEQYRKMRTDEDPYLYLYIRVG